MRRQPLQWAMLGGMIVLVVMFGIDLATSGVERIYGPVEQTEAKQVGTQQLREQTAGGAQSGTTETETQRTNTNTGDKEASTRISYVYNTERTVAEAQRDPEGKSQRVVYVEVPAGDERLPGIPDLHEDTTVNKLADGTAGVLQTLSTQGIRFVVSLFESVTD